MQPEKIFAVLFPMTLHNELTVFPLSRFSPMFFGFMSVCASRFYSDGLFSARCSKSCKGRVSFVLSAIRFQFLHLLRNRS